MPRSALRPRICCSLGFHVPSTEQTITSAVTQQNQKGGTHGAGAVPTGVNNTDLCQGSADVETISLTCTETFWSTNRGAFADAQHWPGTCGSWKVLVFTGTFPALVSEDVGPCGCLCSQPSAACACTQTFGPRCCQFQRHKDLPSS